MRRTRTLLLEGGLVMAAIVLGAILNNPVGYGVAAILAVIFLVAWGLGKEDGEEEFEGYSLFNGAIPVATIAASVNRSLPRAVVTVQDFQHGEPVRVAVKNQGEGAEFYAPLEIGEGIRGATKGLFAKWAHTDTIRTWIAKGETCHLVLARLDQNRLGGGQSSSQWKVLALASDHNVRELAAEYSSLLFPTINKAPNVGISGSVISKPDAENGIQIFKVVLEAFQAVAIEPTAEKLKISQNDPLVYLKVADDDRGGVRATPFVLENLGGGVARKVQIPDVAGAKFDEVDMIPVQRTHEVLPKTDRPQIFGANNILPLLDGLWDQGKSNSNEEIAVRFTISYQDEEKHDFEIDIELTYLSVKDKIRQSSLQRRGSSFLDEEIVKIRHLERRRLS